MAYLVLQWADEEGDTRTKGVELARVPVEGECLVINDVERRVVDVRWSVQDYTTQGGVGMSPMAKTRHGVAVVLGEAEADTEAAALVEELPTIPHDPCGHCVGDLSAPWVCVKCGHHPMHREIECCNPKCNGEWGTNCYHCHHPSFGVRT